MKLTYKKKKQKYLDWLNYQIAQSRYARKTLDFKLSKDKFMDIFELQSDGVR